MAGTRCLLLIVVSCSLLCSRLAAPGLPAPGFLQQPIVITAHRLEVAQRGLERLLGRVMVIQSVERPCQAKLGASAQTQLLAVGVVHLDERLALGRQRRHHEVAQQLHQIAREALA